MRGISDRYMMSLWRQAVLQKWGGKCFFCGNTNTEVLECHHIKKRKHKLTRYMVENGVPVCAVKYGDISCHQRAETFEGMDKIRRALGDDVWFKLDELARKTIPGYCMENGITENEYLSGMKHILDGYKVMSLKNRRALLY
jgi:hypothetical protein